MDGAYQDSWNWFNELDVDKSGTLEEEELELLLLVRQPPRTPRQIRAELCS